MSVAGIQETKWFGTDVWAADGYTFLHSGRLPSDDERSARNEGVGIALDEKATAAWKEAGEAWEAVCYRIVTARLKIASNGQKRPGGSRETANTYVTVVSVYAPTAVVGPTVSPSHHLYISAEHSLASTHQNIVNHVVSLHSWMDASTSQGVHPS